MLEESVQYKPLQVSVSDSSHEAFYRALSVFRAMVQKEKVLSFYKRSSVYEKPSEKRRRKVNESKQKELEMRRELGEDTGQQKKKKRKKDKKVAKEFTNDYDLF